MHQSPVAWGSGHKLQGHTTGNIVCVICRREGPLEAVGAWAICDQHRDVLQEIGSCTEQQRMQQAKQLVGAQQQANRTSRRNSRSAVQLVAHGVPAALPIPVRVRIVHEPGQQPWWTSKLHDSHELLHGGRLGVLQSMWRSSNQGSFTIYVVFIMWRG